RARTGRPLDVPADDAQPLQRVEAVSGALMLLPRALFERIGGFDEGYRLHVEDLDLCRRAREAGATVAVANDVRVVHLRGVSSRSRPGFSEWHKHRGMWRYFRKFEAPQRSIVVRAGVRLAIWLHWASRLPSVLLANRRAGASCTPPPGSRGCGFSRGLWLLTLRRQGRVGEGCLRDQLEPGHPLPASTRRRRGSGQGKSLRLKPLVCCCLSGWRDQSRIWPV